MGTQSQSDGKPKEKEDEKSLTGEVSSGKSDSARSSQTEGGGGDVKKSLRKYIASFGGASVGAGAKALHLLSGPPCRSYRQLISMEEFNQIILEINESQRNDALVAIKNRWKPYKEALTVGTRYIPPTAARGIFSLRYILL